MMLSGKQLKTVYEACQSAYPHEAVGLIIGPDGSHTQDRIIACVNTLARGGERGPQGYACGAGSSFAINPQRLFLIDAEVRAKGWRLKLIYHSHPDGSTELSSADCQAAVAQDGSPLHPNVEYMVVGVKDGAVVAHAFHTWDDRQGGFVTR